MAATTPQYKVILGSSSVARRKILAEMGYEFSIITADIDEKSIRKEKPEELVTALAEAKADAIVEQLRKASNQEEGALPVVLVASDTAEAILQKPLAADYIQDAEPTLLVTSDQVVVYEGEIREKPSCEEEARQFIRGYSGSHAATVTAVLVTNLKTGSRRGEWDRVEIYFQEIPDDVVEKMIQEGTILRVAGGLIIEHPLILPYVKEVVGTTDSVMGLPKQLTENLIKAVL